MAYYEYIEHILGIQTCIKSFSWLYGKAAPPTSQEKYDACKIKLEIVVKPTKAILKEDMRAYDQYSYYYGKHNEKKIYYERKLIGPLKLAYSIAIRENTIKVEVNKNYLRYVKYRFMNLHSMACILSDLVSAMLLFEGYCTMHCAAVNKEEKTVVIFGPPHIGKTITTIQLCEEESNYIAEDITVTDGTAIYAVPWTSTFRCYHHKKEKHLDRIMDALIRHVPILELVMSKRKDVITKYVDVKKIITQGNVTDIILLGRGENSIERLGEEAIEYLINLNQYTLNYHQSPSLLVMQYFNLDFSIDELYRKERKIIHKMISHTQVWKVCANDALAYAKIVKGILEDGKEGENEYFTCGTFK